MPTGNILSRVLMVKSRYGQGAIFQVVVDGREYWITAKHVLTGAEGPPYGSIPTKPVTLQILSPVAEGKHWVSETFWAIDPGNNVDIAVLAPPRPILSYSLPSEPLDAKGVLIGGECEFLGFPFGAAWQATFSKGGSLWMPFVKHCFISASSLSNGSPRLWYLDGINNKGFSGGPVIFGIGLNQRVMAVISGYVVEPLDVIASSRSRTERENRQGRASGRQKKAKPGQNSGFIVAYDIQYALEAIRANPIGALVPPPKK